MYKRSLTPSNSNSFFLFGARGTGKSTLIRQLIEPREVFDEVFEIDLLNPLRAEEATLGLKDLVAQIEAAVSAGKWIFIDEVQKAPKLLDVSQSLIDRRKAKFILTGSSVRKLKRGAANLLAGRAFTYHLFPLTSEELGTQFNLDLHLTFGGLPHIWNQNSNADRVLYLRSYITTYLKEEIAEEQVIRKLEPFTKFLQVAAQTSGSIVNYSNIATGVGVSDQTVKTYFQILEDTLLGFTLPAYDQSVRKAQGKSPKFYLFDTGVLRALQRIVDQPFGPTHFAYGSLFEHFVIQELQRRARYAGKDFLFSFLRLANNDEVDLIVDRPGHRQAVIEIKSTDQIQEKHVKVISRLRDAFKGAEFFVLSRDESAKEYEGIRCLSWQKGIPEILGLSVPRS